MSRSWLTETIAQVDDLLNQINGLPDEVRLYLLDRLIPEPEPEVKPAKKTRKKASRSASKSSRASGMAAALAKNLSRQRQCVAMVDDNGGEMPCGEVESNPIHDPTMGYGGYHEFDAGKLSASSAAPPARGRSSTNGGVENSTASIETGKAAAGVTAGGSNE